MGNSKSCYYVNQPNIKLSDEQKNKLHIYLIDIDKSYNKRNIIYNLPDDIFNNLYDKTFYVGKDFKIYEIEFKAPTILDNQKISSACIIIKSCVDVKTDLVVLGDKITGGKVKKSRRRSRSRSKK